MVHFLKNRNGITMIALVITIIVILILSGIVVASVSSDNGVIKKATEVKENHKIANEIDAIQLYASAKKINDSKQNPDLTKYTAGEVLLDRNLANGDRWKIVSDKATKTVYGTGYLFFEEGTNLPGYGVLENNYILSLNTDEVVELKQEEYVKIGYGENLAVKTNIMLNIDPINMSNDESLGEGVQIFGITEGGGYGWRVTEFKFDGVDDYIQVTKNVNIDNGITFEFYGQSDSSYISMLCKTIRDPNDSQYARRFRCKVEKTQAGNYYYQCCLSGENSESDWVTGPKTKHWLIRKLENFNFAKTEGEYITMTVDIVNNVVSLYINGEFNGSTTCTHSYLINGGLTDKNIPFTIGLETSGSTYTENFSAMSLYACRLYNKVFTAQEVEDNYNKTVASHNLLLQNNN